MPTSGTVYKFRKTAKEQSRHLRQVRHTHTQDNFFFSQANHNKILTSVGEMLLCSDEVGEDDLVYPPHPVVGLQLLQHPLPPVLPQHSVRLPERV